MDGCYFPSLYSATERVGKFNQFFPTEVERISHELDSEIADCPSPDFALTTELILDTLRPATQFRK